jgi:glycosyltransferase involved in cell wall biosynthesis
MISIIIPTYNSEDFLEQCLESIRGQHRELFELIIVDNCSTDSTLDILAQFNDIVDILYSEPDTGNYDAINKGIMASKGKWIYILGADDFLINSAVLFNAHKILTGFDDNVYIAYGNVNVINDDKVILYQSGGEWSGLANLFKSRMSIPHQGVFHRAEAFNKFGLFDTQFKFAGDYDFIMRILNKYRPHYMQIIIAGYRFTGASSKVMAALKIQKEYRLAQKKNSYPLTFTWVFGYARTFLRLIIWQILGNKLAAKVDDCFRVLLGKKPIWTKIYR